jgi:hypothetical protein
VFVLTTCDNTSGGGGTLTVEIAGCPSGAEDCKLYLQLYTAGADPMASSLMATGSILLGSEKSDVMVDPFTAEDIVLDAGDYDLYLWIDVNDDYDTLQEPEFNTDLSHASFPFRVTIDSDTTVLITENGFELFPGWDGSGLTGYYIYAVLGDTAYEWKLGFQMFANDAFGVIVPGIPTTTALVATPDVQSGMTMPNNYVMIQFYGTATGTYSISDMLQAAYAIDGVGWMFTDITLVVTTFEGVGGVIKGTFSGTVMYGSSTMTVEDGQFNVVHAAYTTPY